MHSENVAGVERVEVVALIITLCCISVLSVCQKSKRTAMLLHVLMKCRVLHRLVALHDGVKMLQVLKC